MGARVEVIRRTTTSPPLIVVDRGEEHPPVYTVDQAWALEEQESAIADESCPGLFSPDACLGCQLWDVLRELY